jgi:hypothetical protein
MGRKWFVVIAVEYDRELQANVARCKAYKYNATTETYILFGKAQFTVCETLKVNR